MSPEAGDERGPGDVPKRLRRPGSVYPLLVGVAFIVIIVVAMINTLGTEDSGVIGASDEGDLPLAQFAVPDVRSDLEGDANIAQDDCSVSQVPCPDDERRTPACEVDLEGALRVCDYFAKPLVLSFWFTRGGDCEAQQDVFEAVYRRERQRANFLAVNVRDDRDEVRSLAEDHGWTHPIGLDADGALSNRYRVGGCPTFLYAFPGGILHATSIGELDQRGLTKKVDELIEASNRRAEVVH